MTLEPYNAERLDQLSLRMLDLCARLRKLANTSRQEELPALDLHDHKALEWLTRFEDWLYRAEGEMGRLVHKNQGEQTARRVQSARPK